MKMRLMYAVLFSLLAGLLSAAAAEAASAARVEGTVNINQAGAAELQLLPGIGKTRAAAIIEYRAAKPFADPAELVKVKGIGRKLFLKIKDHVTVSGPTTIAKVKPAAASKS